MTEDSRDRRLADLELSLRAAELLASTGLETVRELMALPRLVLPGAWPRKVAKLVAAEIDEVFETVFQETGEEFAGEIVLPPPKEAELRAEGDVPARMRTIDSWLAQHFPQLLAELNPPASKEAIAAAEADLGCVLPDDYKQFLAIHDGQQEASPMVRYGALLRVSELADARRGIFNEETPIDPESAGPGVRPVSYCERWIPIGRSARGRDFLCIDLDPAPGGVVGQIIEFVVDFDERPLVARSFADLLSLYFEQVQTGEIDLEAAMEDRD